MANKRAAAYLEQKITMLESQLTGFWPDHQPQVDVLFEAMDYSLLAGGKRLRPVLHLATLEMLGQDSTPYLPFACALEMIHTYSLIHDDLPAMDNDTLRRGKPTCHVAYGEANAILAGDALLTHAFALMLAVPSQNPSALIQAVQRVALAAGTEGMVVGQIADIAAEGRAVSLDELRYIYANKTGALFSAAIVSAGIIGGATEKEQAALEEFARSFGIAFQIADDILDVVGDEQKLGKPIGSDAKNAKMTYPALVGMDEARRLGAEATQTALDSLACFGERAQNLVALVQLCADRDH